jgi:hypothetical protein
LSATKRTSFKNKPVLVDKREIKQYSLIQSNERENTTPRVIDEPLAK